MQEEGENITTDIEITEILNNFGMLFKSEDLNKVPEFNFSYIKIKASMTRF